MFSVRIHGRGGQGAVTAAEILSVAAFNEGRHAQAFPTFGSERTGAPVVSFCRIDDKPIRLREPINEPDALIVQDPTLLHQVNLFEGLNPEGYLLVNTSHRLTELGLEDLDDADVGVPPRAATAQGEGHARRFGHMSMLATGSGPPRSERSTRLVPMVRVLGPLFRSHPPPSLRERRR